jgi:prepilin-type N-terminal cleavage/methylation domain-containing protein
MSTDRCKFTGPGMRGFTLIELLVVISIIGIVAGLVLGAAALAGGKKTVMMTTAELKSIELALETFKGKHGEFPRTPGSNPLVNQLFYELTGVNYIPDTTPYYRSVVDPGHQLTIAQINNAFSVPGFLNNIDTNSTTEGMINLNPQQYGKLNGTDVYLLVVPAKPVGNSTNRVNYWRYKAYDPNGYNPTSYDLWAEIPAKNTLETNIIGNWNTR